MWLSIYVGFGLGLRVPGLDYSYSLLFSSGAFH